MSTVEPQYQILLDLHKKRGLTPLGLMTNQVWQDDPRRLGILLARYKFVSKMLAGKKSVLEVGCGDAFGARVVQQEVPDVTVSDIDPAFIADIESRNSKEWPLKTLLHDAVQSKVPGSYDAVYSLDVLEHISAEHEEAFVANISAPLPDDGVLIIGMPSIQSQAYASPASKAGHINCKDAVGLRQLLLKQFANVFIFSMNDEVVHTGFYPMAHYLLALCCGQKRT
jgi:2-polyprenyl-3-methyl-5-hydroxy-6-metoxy-1,4-benzoquinol methylase